MVIKPARKSQPLLRKLDQNAVFTELPLPSKHPRHFQISWPWVWFPNELLWSTRIHETFDNQLGLSKPTASRCHQAQRLPCVGNEACCPHSVIWERAPKSTFLTTLEFYQSRPHYLMATILLCTSLIPERTKPRTKSFPNNCRTGLHIAEFLKTR